MRPFPLYPVGREPHAPGPRQRAAEPPVEDGGGGLGEQGGQALEDLSEGLERLRSLIRMLDKDPSQDPVIMDALNRQASQIANFIASISGERPPSIIGPEVAE